MSRKRSGVAVCVAALLVANTAIVVHRQWRPRAVTAASRAPVGVAHAVPAASPASPSCRQGPSADQRSEGPDLGAYRYDGPPRSRPPSSVAVIADSTGFELSTETAAALTRFCWAEAIKFGSTVSYWQSALRQVAATSPRFAIVLLGTNIEPGGVAATEAQIRTALATLGALGPFAAGRTCTIWVVPNTSAPDSAAHRLAVAAVRNYLLSVDAGPGGVVDDTNSLVMYRRDQFQALLPVSAETFSLGPAGQGDGIHPRLANAAIEWFNLRNALQSLTDPGGHESCRQVPGYTSPAVTTEGEGDVRYTGPLAPDMP